MKRRLTNLISPAILGFLLVIPFIIMELTNRKGFNEGFPFPLFLILWFLPAAFSFVLIPIVKNALAKGGFPAAPSSLLRIAFLVLIASVWIRIVVDQMPCFRGVPNCD